MNDGEHPREDSPRSILQDLRDEVSWSSLPEYQSTISEEAVYQALAEVIELKRKFAEAVRIVTAREVDPDIFIKSKGVVGQMQFADGMLRALDLVAPINDGTNWDTVATHIAETPQAGQS